MASASNGEQARSEAAKSPTPTLKTHCFATGFELKESLGSLGGGSGVEEEQEQEKDGDEVCLELEKRWVNGFAVAMAKAEVAIFPFL